MKKKAGLLTAVFLLAAATGCGEKQIRDQVTVEAGQELELLGEDFFEGPKKELEKISFDLSQVNLNQVGSYPVTAVLGRKKYSITVHVEDRTPPMVELTGHVIFTDDLAGYDPMQLIAGVYDASAYSVALIRYAWEADLGEVSDLGWESMEALMLEQLSQEELKSLGTTEIPEEEGIYRGVLAVTDIYDNVWLEQLWIVLKKQQAEEKETLDEEGHWEDEGQTLQDTASDSDGDVFSGREEAVPGGGEDAPAGGGAGKKPVSAAEEESTPENDPAYYDTHLDEGQIAAINAGYYKVVPDPRYGGYIVMVHGKEGSYGTRLIREYLASIGCEAVGGSGDWISIDNDQYAVYVTAEEIRPAGEGEISDW